MMYEISPILTINLSDLTNIVLAPPINVFTADQHITAWSKRYLLSEVLRTLME
jgi:hypothetical protein